MSTILRLSMSIKRLKFYGVNSTPVYANLAFRFLKDSKIPDKVSSESLDFLRVCWLNHSEHRGDEKTVHNMDGEMLQYGIRSTSQYYYIDVILDLFTAEVDVMAHLVTIDETSSFSHQSDEQCQRSTCKVFRTQHTSGKYLVL